MPGIYYRIKKGQTLWKLSRIYNVDLDRLAKINHISNTSKIEVGQLIFIPTTESSRPIQQAVKSEDFIWPLKGRVIRRFGQMYGYITNRGLDIQGLPGTAVVASRSGKVVFCSEELTGGGKTIIIDHGDNFFTIYTHNSKLLVKAGDKVLQGQRIAKVGRGDNSEDSYLHFQIRKRGLPQDPYLYLPVLR
jgi:murein DD-endopeptidase MepM/ murein hydrolase activator NlpD